MNRFIFGLSFGLASGMVLSLFKNRDGKRLGADLKPEFESWRHESTQLKQAIQHANLAKQELAAQVDNLQKANAKTKD